MVAKAITIYVKGVPEEGKLGDCPFCHRALLTLELKGLEYSKEYIDFKNKPAWLVEQAQGKVPVLKVDDKLIPDSDVICKYLEDTYPDRPLGPLTVAGVGERLFPSFVQFLKSEHEDCEEKQAAMLEQLDQVEAHLAANGPFMHGETMGAADATVVPRLYHMSVALPHFKHYHLPEKYVNIRSLLNEAKQTPAFKATDYGEDMIIKGWTTALESAKQS